MPIVMEGMVPPRISRRLEGDLIRYMFHRSDLGGNSLWKHSVRKLRSGYSAPLLELQIDLWMKSSGCLGFA